MTYSFLEDVHEHPPCADSCANMPKRCAQRGWFQDEVFMYWKDQESNTCVAIKSPVPPEALYQVGANGWKLWFAATFTRVLWHLYQGPTGWWTALMWMAPSFFGGAAENVWDA